MTNPVEIDHRRGIALFESGDFHGALAAYDAALETAPASAAIHYSRGNVLAKLNRPGEAIAAYGACLDFDPAHLSARYNRATLHASMQSWALALADLDEALRQAPNMVDAWNNRAAVLQAAGRHDQALKSIAQVLRLRPSDFAAYYNAGIALLALNRFDEAIQAFERTLHLAPHHGDAIAGLGLAALRACDWPKLETLLPTLLEGLARESIALSPLAFLAISDDPFLQRKCAEISTRRTFAGTALEGGGAVALCNGVPYEHQRLRVGYISADFREHPVANQVAGLLESHNRERFEIIGFATGTGDHGSVRRRIQKACDHFHDIGDIGSFDAARFIRQQEVDILVDLNGQTLGWRPAIFKYRPAPVHVSFLGYAGTTGTDFIDYVIGDVHVTPSELAPAMTEKIVQLPHSFWPTDPRLPEPSDTTRTQAGLPQDAFVFCCFNANHKIRPEIFACWMRLLNSIPNAVLWLREGSPAMNARFREQARMRGIDGSRIIFAHRVESFAEHLGRMRQADLFLDTFPYNAHVTASDALWAGLPVVTLRGRSFAARVAASFLANLGLDDLVASTLEGYGELARSLAMDAGRLARIRDRLWDARRNGDFFNVCALAGDLERAYAEMIKQLGSGPAAFHVPPLDR